MAQLEVNDVSVSFGAVTALDRVSLAVEPGEIFAIIGPNGAGKTSLLNVISRIYRPSAGQVLFEGRDITRLPRHKIVKLGIARTFQNIALFKGLSVLDNVMLGRHVHMRTGLWDAALYVGRASRDEARHRAVCDEIIDFLGLAPNRKQIVGALPYGVQKRVELARALAAGPKLLLLDEPMAGMTVEEKEEMVGAVLDINEDRGITVILIEHDMGVVMDISRSIVVLDFGKKIAEGSPDSVRRDPTVIRAYLGEEDEVLRQKEREAEAASREAGRTTGHQRQSNRATGA
jgi:branched-chain amino acid transport system ATP-binding protein